MSAAACHGCAAPCETPLVRLTPLRVALIGQPNCGKSTIFNFVAGYRSATANFPGTTVHLERSQVRVNGSAMELVDVPGIYSLTATSPVEKAAKRFMLERGADVIVNVVDSSLLSRSLELTLELRELGVPMVVCLNMADDARRKGIQVSAAQLSMLLDVPVVETIASRGLGVRELFGRAIAQENRPPSTANATHWQPGVEQEIARVQSSLNGCGSFPPARFVAVKLLEADEEIQQHVSREARQVAQQSRARLQRAQLREAESVIMAERHDRAMRLFEQSATVGRPQKDFRLMLDNWLTHRVFGYLFLLALLAGFFYAIFGIGRVLEAWTLGAFESGWTWLAGGLTPGTLAFAIARSVWDGFAGGAGIVLPYLVPFLIGLALLEDVGYLPRVAYLLDGLLHRMGLHGTSVVPLILGYGCTVPACLATRILACPRDRFAASLLASLVPCSARSTVIFAMVAFYLGPGWALGIYALNAVVVFASGWLLKRVWPETSPGIILEVPRYQVPSAKIVSRKVWLRLREFVVVSWPLIVAGSVILSLASYWKLDGYVNAALSPLTMLLGLPLVVGTTLVFGVFRKELSMVMLAQALGTTQIAAAMSAPQILVYTVFVTFYIPCLATLVAMTKELGGLLTLKAAAYTLALATALAAGARMLFL